MESVFLLVFICISAFYVRELAHKISRTDLLYMLSIQDEYKVWFTFSSFAQCNALNWCFVLKRCSDIVAAIFFFALGRKNYVSGR